MLVELTNIARLEHIIYLIKRYERIESQTFPMMALMSTGENAEIIKQRTQESRTAIEVAAASTLLRIQGILNTKE